MNNALVIDIVELFQKTFNSKPYLVKEVIAEQEINGYRLRESISKVEQEFTAKGSLIKEQFRGVEVMLPIRFYDGPVLITYLPFCVISVRGGKTIVETALAEQIGTVKEQFNTDDYEFNIKGFLISEDRKFPEAEIDNLRTLFETQKAVTIDNALSNIYLSNPKLKPDEQRRVVIYNFDLQEVQGGREHVRPFSMMVKSDTVFTLELE